MTTFTRLFQYRHDGNCLFTIVFAHKFIYHPTNVFGFLCTTTNTHTDAKQKNKKRKEKMREEQNEGCK